MQVSELFKQSNTILLDGGMGTMLQAAGLKLGARPEELNITDPQLIEGIHAQYAAAGSRIPIFPSTVAMCIMSASTTASSIRAKASM